MKRTLKVLGIVIGSLLGILVVIGLVFIYGSKFIKAKQEIDDPVYEVDKIWAFKAGFYDDQDSIVRVDTIELTTYNQRFLIFQNKVTWSLKKGNKEIEQTTGIVENENKIWLHPPRFDDYYEYTEYSAFPEVRKPIMVGETWSTTLMLGSYATEESGPKLEVAYKIESVDTLEMNPLNRKAIILGQGTSGLGKYEALMTFTDKLGFIEMNYIKNNGEKLVIELIYKNDRE